MDNKYNFIKTFDKDTADKLMNTNLKLVSNDNNCWVFLLDKHQTFATDTLDKVIFCNTMCL